MALTIDAMAERYGKLPTEVLRDASTVDLIVFDVALSYKNYQQRKANSDGKPVAPQMSMEQMQEAWERVKK